jgi:protein-tyrosine phosphatase/nucleoside diphosphate kinase
MSGAKSNNLRSGRLELTIALLLPEVKGDTAKMVAHFLHAGFHILNRQELTGLPREAADLLSLNVDDPATYDKTFSTLTSQKTEVFSLCKVDAVADLLNLIGPRDPFVARKQAPTTIRALYGIDEVNCAILAAKSLSESKKLHAWLFPEPQKGSQEWVLAQLMPTISEGLSQLAGTRPEDPYTWLANWLSEYRPENSDEADDVYTESVIEGCCLKSDRFEGIGKLTSSNDEGLAPNGASLTPHEDPSAISYWNYRKCAGVSPVYGMGQSTKSGIQTVLAHIGLKGGYEKIVCLNMREEPVLFLDGLPVAPRIEGHLNDNILHLGGIDGDEIALMEKKFQEEVLELLGRSSGFAAEAPAAGGETSSSADENSSPPPESPFVIYHQRKDMSNYPKEIKWSSDEPLKNRVETLPQVYAQLGCAVPLVYHRIPITDENAPSIEALDALVDVMRSNLDSYPAFVANCQMGRGRTTTAMVCMCVYWRIRGYLPLPDEATDASSKAIEDDLSLQRSVTEIVRERQRDLKNGEYQTILRLIQILPRGLMAKRHLDAAVDECGAFHNLRTSIFDAKTQADEIKQKEKETGCSAGEGRDHGFWLNRALNYLQRYYWLLIFTSYLLENTHNGFESSFQEYVRRNWMLVGPIAYASLD